MSVSSRVVSAIGRRTHREGFVRVDGVEMYQIRDYDRLQPFLISITSESDLWMYASSAGGITAGRGDADHALFPYESVDRLHRGYGISGGATLLRVWRNAGPAVMWEPFACQSSHPSIERNLYKSAAWKPPDVRGSASATAPDFPVYLGNQHAVWICKDRVADE